MSYLHPRQGIRLKYKGLSYFSSKSHFFKFEMGEAGAEEHIVEGWHEKIKFTAGRSSYRELIGTHVVKDGKEVRAVQEAKDGSIEEFGARNLRAAVVKEIREGDIEMAIKEKSQLRTTGASAAESS
ncbi:hypothetical protein H0H92_014316 [Tricholoma furcatifolium]|nr:hypothetical protein H0H92_014316 [Tricholoma furcatifolium]